MSKLKSFDAEIFAMLFVDHKNPFESGLFSYFVKVGSDESQKPDSIYADDLPISELLLIKNSDAVNVFCEKCDTENEYLIKVLVDKKEKKLETKILMRPTNLN